LKRHLLVAAALSGLRHFYATGLNRDDGEKYLLMSIDPA